MKILVLELARLGDIFQTWPALRAMKRLHPDSQIEVLTRSRFQAALDGLEVVSKQRILPTTELITPLLESQLNVKASYDLLTTFIDELKAEKYDWILNFSFSPFSSYLTHALAEENTKVTGYSRTSDGFLAIPDDMSAYFYAQVGVNRSNRYHLAEIFGTMVGADLMESDWKSPEGLKAHPQAPEVIVHVGASEGKKQISPIKWITILNQFAKLSSVKVGLVGSPAEAQLAGQIVNSMPEDRIVNFAGKTNLYELFELIKGAKLVVGADSAPMHMASLTGTACLNLSLSTVNFWETGPRAQGSYVMRGNDETDFVSDKVAMAMKKILTGEKQEIGMISLQKGSPSYWMLAPKEVEFQWNFLKAIYMSEAFPPNDQPLFQDGIVRMADINLLMIEQMQSVQKGANLEKVAGIINRGEEIIETIGKLVPSLAVLVRWYQTEKVRIGPDTPEKLLEKSLGVQLLLQNVLELYLQSYGLTAADLQIANTPEEVAK